MQSVKSNYCDSAVCVLKEGDKGEKEDQRQQMEGEKNLIGQAESLIDCQVVMETLSEEVVTHHLDELWQLRPFRGEEMLLCFTFVPWGSIRRPWRRQRGVLQPARGESHLMSR